MEENAHFVTNLSDCTREFQQFWIDSLVTEMLAKHKIEL